MMMDDDIKSNLDGNKMLALLNTEEQIKDEYSDGPSFDPTELVEEGYVDIARIEAGGSFGELALSDGKPRMSTVKTLTNVHLLVLNRHAYNKSIDAIERKRIE